MNKSIENPAEEFASVIAEYESNAPRRRYNEGGSMRVLLDARSSGRDQAAYSAKKASERLNVSGLQVRQEVA